MTIKINDLDRDRVMAKKKDICFCGSNCSCIPWDNCVAQNDRLTIEIEEDELAKILHKRHQEEKHKHLRLDWEDKNLSKKYYIDIAKHLKSTIKTWAKVGMER